ncbi:MAG: sulfur-oxidizing protein SoxY [Gammaproteobacteria bacterium]|jgi:sulfur-oxidizing protein SoxY
METINTTRRTLLKGTTLATMLGMTGIVQMLTMSQAHASWPKNAFDSKSMSELMEALFDEDLTPEESASVILKAPDIAENGAVVPIGIESSIPGITRIVVLVEENPSPMVASFNLGEGARADISTRIKMGKTSDVIALVEANGKVYAARKNVKVTIGGCGG